MPLNKPLIQLIFIAKKAMSDKTICRFARAICPGEDFLATR
jgi:hypothetical protein